MRDVIEDDGPRIKPLSVLMLVIATSLGGAITYNAMFGQHLQNHNGSEVRMGAGSATHMDVTVPAEVTNTVVFKYDPAIEDVQRELLATGHFKGLVDGVNGQKTKIAIQHYQQDNGLPITGEVTPDLMNHIRYTRKVQAAAEYTGSIDKAPLVDSALSKIHQVQATLSAKGYEVGDMTGTMTEATHAAILKYEMDNGLAMDGVVDATLVASLSGQ